MELDPILITGLEHTQHLLLQVANEAELSAYSKHGKRIGTYVITVLDDMSRY